MPQIDRTGDLARSVLLALAPTTHHADPGDVAGRAWDLAFALERLADANHHHRELAAAERRRATGADIGRLAGRVGSIEDAIQLLVNDARDRKAEQLVRKKRLRRVATLLDTGEVRRALADASRRTR